MPTHQQLSSRCPSHFQSHYRRNRARSRADAWAARPLPPRTPRRQRRIDRTAEHDRIREHNAQEPGSKHQGDEALRRSRGHKGHTTTRQPSSVARTHRISQRLEPPRRLHLAQKQSTRERERDRPASAAHATASMKDIRLDIVRARTLRARNCVVVKKRE